MFKLRQTQTKTRSQWHRVMNKASHIFYITIACIISSLSLLLSSPLTFVTRHSSRNVACRLLFATPAFHSSSTLLSCPLHRQWPRRLVPCLSPSSSLSLSHSILPPPPPPPPLFLAYPVLRNACGTARAVIFRIKSCTKLQLPLHRVDATAGIIGMQANTHNQQSDG